MIYPLSPNGLPRCLFPARTYCYRVYRIRPDSSRPRAYCTGLCDTFQTKSRAVVGHSPEYSQRQRGWPRPPAGRGRSHRLPLREWHLALDEPRIHLRIIFLLHAAGQQPPTRSFCPVLQLHAEALGWCPWLHGSLPQDFHFLIVTVVPLPGVDLMCNSLIKRLIPGRPNPSPPEEE